MPTQAGIFAKHWTPGRVKTRLAAAIGAGASAEVARAFLETLVSRLRDQGDSRVIGFAPAERLADFAGLAGDDWRLVEQCQGDLGQRMRHYFDASFAAGAERVVLLGADSPNVPVEIIQEAFRRLERERLVLGPTDDGGYFLIGARGEPPPVFDAMPWSSPELWRATEGRLAESGWRRGVDWSPLPGWYDVDTIDDMARLRRDLANSTGEAALERLAERLEAILGG